MTSIRQKFIAVAMAVLLSCTLVPAAALAVSGASADVAYAATKAKAKKKTYKVKYVLNGGKNVKANKTKYTGTLKFKNPTKKGYTFKGWYSDKKCTKRVKSVKGKNITVYAKWSKKASSEKTSTKSSTVYLSATGTKYHTKYCRTLKKTPTAVSLSYAESHGYEACKVCH